MIKNRYPIPLIPELINQLCDAKYSPNWTFNGGTTTFGSKKEMSGRQPFGLIEDCLNPQ